MIQLGWFSTGRGEGSRALLTAVQESILRRELKARIAFVFSNREPGEHEGSDRFFDLVRGYGLPLVCHSSRKFRRRAGGDFPAHRAQYDREVMEMLKPYSPDLCVLAGYMLIVSGEMCRRYTMLNLHPAAPDGPKGTWQEVIWELIGARATNSGIKIHIATEELDAGPVVTYCTYPIKSRELEPLWKEAKGRSLKELQAQGEEQPLFRAIRCLGMVRELPLILSTLKAFAEGQLRVSGGYPVDSSGRRTSSLCLNDVVEEAVGKMGGGGS